jgi:hypothetical protein
MTTACDARAARLFAVGVSPVLVLLLAGCGEQPTYPVSGKVTYKGQPVPAGSVVFSPAPGSSGTGAVAEIRDGSYVTAPDSGVSGGPYLVVVRGHDGKPAPGGDGGIEPRGKPLFLPHERTVDLPAGGHVLDIEVPATTPTR